MLLQESLNLERQLAVTVTLSSASSSLFSPSASATDLFIETRRKMGYWKSKVLPKIKKVFEKNPSKKVAAAEVCKSFDGTKEEINKEFEEKKVDLQPKVLEIYEASSVEVKGLIKERKDAAGIKKQSAAVHAFLEELVKIEFPGAKAAHEASTKFGPELVSGPVFFVFEKVSTYIVEEEVVAPPPAVEGEPTTKKDKDIVVETDKEKEEVVLVAVVEEEKKTEEVVPPKEEAAAAAEPPKP